MVKSTVRTGTVGVSDPLDPSSEHVYVFPVTFAQQRLLFLHQLDPASTSYSVPWSIRITGSLNAEALERSLNEIVRRHEVLRTTFDVVEGHPVQIVSPWQRVPLVRIDLSGSEHPEREAQAAAITEAQTPLDLKSGPLVRTTLLQLGECDFVVLITTHHIAFDGWSRRVLVSELGTLYHAYCNGRPSPLPELPLQYADYAVWQRNYLQGEGLENLLKYWKQQLAGAPTTLDLPTDRPRPAVQSFRGASKSFVFPKSLSDAVARASRQFGTTQFMTLLAAFYVLLTRYSGQDDIMVGAVIANRNRAEVEDLIGLFANTLPLRTRLDGDPSFGEILRRVKDAALGAYAHQDMPFERLVEELRPERSLSYNPLFQVLFSLQSGARRSFELDGLQLQPLGGMVGTTAKFDMSFFILEGADGLSGKVEYNTDLFDADTIDRMLRHYLRLLDTGLADPEKPISRLSLLDDAERHKILVEFNQTGVDFPRETRLHDFMAKQAEKTPSATALVCGEERISYRDLNRCANQLANYLVKRGAGPEVLVGIHTERSVRMLVGILGILKSGSAYVPLDPMYPRERIYNILEDSRAPLVLSQETIASDLPGFGGQCILLDRDWAEISREGDVEPQTSVGPSNLAYVLFTSGSTGRPKGVAIEHHSAATFVHWAQQAFEAQELAGVLLSTSICFDLSVFEMFAPLSVGGKVIIADNALFLPSLPAKGEVTLINTVPSAMAELLRMSSVPESVTTVNLAGEALPEALVEQIYANTNASRVYNLYGPTEDTTYSTYTLVPRGATVTVGRPLANSQAYILDAERKPVPIGVPGELFLAGEGLARGYCGRPDLTCERFVPNPFDESPGARMYRTGDLARFLPDGNIDYLGRIDHQVKLRGFRIELGEIEAVLLEHPDVERVVVVVREDRPGDKRLVAYLVPRAGRAIDIMAIRTHLEQSVPGYMVPSAFVKLNTLPMTDNGKVNRRALPPPDWFRDEVTDRKPPADQLELMLVRVWERVLGISSIGVDDNFFDIGGHSLLAVRLLSEVEKVVGRKVPLASLFRGSTVASQAKLLREGTESDPEPLVVEYQAGHSGSSPFFAVAAPGVRSLGYALLGRNLGESQPFYKLQASGPIAEGRPLNWGELRTLAQQYIAGMRAVQPEGPYYIVAMCGGCQIAEQMILQLESQGQIVALFAIFDTWVMEHAHRKWGWRLFGLQQRVRWLKRVSFSEQFTWAKRALGNRVQIWQGKSKATQPWAEAYWPEDFKPPRFSAPVILFKRPKQPYYYVDDPLMGWGARSRGGVRTYEISASHHEVLREPHVQLVSKVLLDYLSLSERGGVIAEVTETRLQASPSA
jgi:amino acid adenylation domain-containing protein